MNTTANTHIDSENKSSSDETHKSKNFLFFALIFLLVLAATSFYYLVQTRLELVKLRNQDSEMRALDKKFVPLSQDTSKNENYDYQYSEYLSKERVLLEGLYGRSNVFTSYQYGFSFDQSSKEIPLSCQEDKNSLVSAGPSGPGNLTVICNWSEDQYNKDSRVVAETIVNNHNLVTPITFTLSFSESGAPEDEAVYDKTNTGVNLYKNVAENQAGMSYFYSFYSPREVDTLRNIFTGDHIKYTLNLEVFDETDEAAIDELAKKIIGQVTFVNLVE